MELTDSDRAAIAAVKKGGGNFDTFMVDAYRAGMAAGLERGALACEGLPASPLFDGAGMAVVIATAHCAAACRALAKP